MIPAEIIAREKRLATPAAVAAFASVIAFIGAILASQGVTPSGDSDAEFLRDFDANQSGLLLAAVFQALGMLLLAGPLAYLFRAAAARSDKVRSAWIGVTVAGPVFIAIGAILQWIAFDQAATDFLTGGGPPSNVDVNDFANDLIQEQSTFSAAQGFTFAGTLGLLAALVYTSLHAMRTGLLTRFWGTLGMALGVSLLFLGPIGVIVFMLALALIYVDRWPGGRPEAWDAGRAIPWPSPGDKPPEPPEPEPDPDEPNPVFDGTAAPAPSSNGGEGPDSPALPPPPPQKRKRRDGE
jgi:hypothetical protein